MERPTRRSATAVNGLSSAATNGSSGSSRRRRREADRDSGGGGVSDGADTDSSAVAVEMGTSARTSKASASKKAVRSAAATVRGKSVVGGVDADADADGTADHSGRADDEDVDSEDPVHEDDQTNANAHEEETPMVSGYATRARRERSQSVVSTTSDTSSIASTSSRPGHGEDEDEDEELRPELHVEKLAELEKKKKMVEDGSLAEYCRRVAEFKEERNRLLQSAEWHKNLQLKNTADLFGFEVQRAHNLWQDSKDKLKREMLARSDALLQTLRGELETLEKAGRLPTHVVQPKKAFVLPPRKLAVTAAVTVDKDAVADADLTPRPSVDKEEAGNEGSREEEEEGEEQPTTTSTEPTQKRRKVVAASAPMPANVLRLPLDAISSDLASIMNTREAASAKIHTALPAARLGTSDSMCIQDGKYGTD
jgi:hypothetical protein